MGIIAEIRYIATARRPTGKLSSMSDDARLIEIETRLAFQEHTLGELGDLVHRQRQELDALRSALMQATADLDALRTGLSSSGAASEPPPPHY